MIIPSAKYPAQTAIDLVNYPQGKARNVTASADGTGTPLEKDWINDAWGFFQALVLQAGITPNGSPDTAPASQLLQAVQAIAQQRTVAAYRITSGVRKNSTELFPLSLIYQYGGFTLSGGNSIVVPKAGYYRIGFSGIFDASSVANPTFLSATIYAPGDLTVSGVAWRYSANPGDAVSLSAESVQSIGVPGAQAIAVASLTAAMQCSPATFGTLAIERVG